VVGGIIDRRYNAKTHGAQSRPSEVEILAHLEIILGDGASDMRLDPSDSVTFAALELADREARLDAAQAAYVAAQSLERDGEWDAMIGSIEDVLCEVYLNARDLREGRARLLACNRQSIEAALRLKLLAGCYLREAESKRHVALVAYLACAEADFPKRTISHP